MPYVQGGQIGKVKKNISQGILGYTKVEKNGIISYSYADASTNHLPKLVRGNGIIQSLSSSIEDEGCEVAFYRRYRNHDSISSDNAGGRRLPDMFLTDTKDCTLTEEETSLLKQYGIPIVYINKGKYKKIEQSKEEDKIDDKNDEER